MNIAVVGTGYVGLVHGTILSDFGYNVTCLDIDKNKIDNLKKSILPIYEPDLKEIIQKNFKNKNLSFSTDIIKGVKESEVIFIAVGTPPLEDGSADLNAVLDIAKLIGENITTSKIIVIKSTVPVGTGDKVESIIAQELKLRGVSINFSVISNPEFLREGRAVKDSLQPDRIIIGGEDIKAIEQMKNLYLPFITKNIPVVSTDRKTAELIKYASNSFLAVKISFINELSSLAEKIGANTRKVAFAMGLDKRISPDFLQCGAGFGGSCFPKDTKAIINLAKTYEEELSIISAAISANEKQKSRMIEKIVSNMGNLSGKTLAVLGLSFKPETDDVREAPSLDIIKGIVKYGGKVKTFCPKGIDEGKIRLNSLSDSVIFCENEIETTTDIEGIVLVTEWDLFKKMDIIALKNRMKDSFYFDLRNIFVENPEIKKHFKYFPVGER